MELHESIKDNYAIVPKTTNKHYLCSHDQDDHLIAVQ
jgi:hypothetical protein